MRLPYNTTTAFLEAHLKETSEMRYNSVQVYSSTLPSPAHLSLQWKKLQQICEIGKYLKCNVDSKVSIL